MTPTPPIELQRRLTLVGAIRIGGEKPARGVGKRLEAFRLTSARKELIEQAAQLYGGEVTPWQSPAGDEWQVYTETDDLPVLIMPAYSLRQRLELWQGVTKRLRSCDGFEEELSGGPCLCRQRNEEACDLYTRLVVALPELETLLGWILRTRGANAAHELPTGVALAEAAAPGQPFVPARLRLDQRRGVKDGQTVRFVVPTLDPGISYAAIASNDKGYTPVPKPPPHPAGVDRPPLALTVQKNPETRKSRKPPIGPSLDELREHKAPAASEDAPAPEPSPTQTIFASDAQKKKLNVLVGRLREQREIDTIQLWHAIATLRPGSQDLFGDLGGYDDHGVLHWSPLRESLTRPEANQLIEWLEKKESRVAAEAAKSAEDMPWKGDVDWKAEEIEWPKD